MGKINLVFVMTSCKKCGPVNQTLNIIKNIDKNKYNISLITIYSETEYSMLDEYKKNVDNYYHVNLSKIDIILNNTKNIKSLLEKIKPDIIHSVGVFPNYLISKIKKYKHIFTLRNYLYDDFIPLYGKIRGNLLAKLQLYAIKNSDKVVTCSKSLKDIYWNKLKLDFDYIQNGTDIDKFYVCKDKKKIRKKLNLDSEKVIFVFSGLLISRKNVDFLIDNFIKALNDKNCILLILGDGEEFLNLTNKYKQFNNVIFKGNVDNVNEFLSASDICVSCSKSEGLPNSILEAMSCGNAVLLSNISQHLELLESSDLNVGFSFDLNDSKDLISKFKKIIDDNYSLMGTN